MIHRQKRVLAYPGRRDAPLHEIETTRAIASWLARIHGLEYAGDHDDARHCEAGFYLVPAQTIVGREQRRSLRLTGPDDLYGGYVDYDFIATKAITHPLRAPGAVAPSGWSPRFAERVRDVVLDGVTVFSVADARLACAERLASGPLRLKPIHACGGRSQMVVRSIDEIEALLVEASIPALFEHGVVLEEELEDVATYSVGQISIGGRTLSYHGRQHLAGDAHGSSAYGGSDLLIVQGGYDDLLLLDLVAEERLAVEQAQIFDAAADAAYPVFFASRRNYDIARGTAHDGRIRSGVLEQSWRMGGASSAEIAALQAFIETPSLRAVHASSVELYRDQALPANATELFRGADDEVGFILKYATVEPA